MYFDCCDSAIPDTESGVLSETEADDSFVIPATCELFERMSISGLASYLAGDSSETLEDGDDLVTNDVQDTFAIPRSWESLERMSISSMALSLEDDVSDTESDADLPQTPPLRHSWIPTIKINTCEPMDILISDLFDGQLALSSAKLSASMSDGMSHLKSSETVYYDALDEHEGDHSEVSSLISTSGLDDDDSYVSLRTSSGSCMVFSPLGSTDKGLGLGVVAGSRSLPHMGHLSSKASHCDLRTIAPLTQLQCAEWAVTVYY